MNKYFREPANGFTHLIGALLSFIGLLVLVIKTSIDDPSPLSLSAVIIFGVSLMLLYIASTIYHLSIYDEEGIKVLRRIDHAMIFILIAGSYAPFCLISLKGPMGYILFSIECTIAILGVCFKLIWFRCPRWISTSIYVLMGWMAIFLIVPLYKVLSYKGLLLLILGGVLYTIGALIYNLKPNISLFKNFQHHEIFHVFVMLGSLAHYLCVLIYVI